MKRYQLLLYMAALLLSCAACTKNGEAVTEVRKTRLELNLFSVDSLLVKIDVDGASLVGPTRSPFKSLIVPLVTHTTPAHRYVITDFYSSRVILDTALTYSNTNSNRFFFLQMGAGAKLTAIGTPANEPAPPTGKVKIAFAYTLASLPDEIKVVVEDSQSGTSDFDYVQVASFNLKKGHLSPYFLALSGTGKKRPKLKFYTNTASPVLLIQSNLQIFGSAPLSINIYHVEPNNPNSWFVTNLN